MRLSRPLRKSDRTQQSSRSVTWCPTLTVRRTSPAIRARPAVTSRLGSPGSPAGPVPTAATMSSASTGQRAPMADPLPARRRRLLLTSRGRQPRMSPIPPLASRAAPVRCPTTGTRRPSHPAGTVPRPHTGRRTSIQACRTRLTVPIRTARPRITTLRTLTGRRILTRQEHTALPTSTAPTRSGRPKQRASRPHRCTARRASPVRASRGRQPPPRRRPRPPGLTRQAQPRQRRPVARPKPRRRPGRRPGVLRFPRLRPRVPTGYPRRRAAAVPAVRCHPSRPPAAAPAPGVPAACTLRALCPSRMPTDPQMPPGA